MALKSLSLLKKQRFQPSLLSPGLFHNVLCCLLNSIRICATRVQPVPPGADASADISELGLIPAYSLFDKKKCSTGFMQDCTENQCL